MIFELQYSFNLIANMDVYGNAHTYICTYVGQQDLDPMDNLQKNYHPHLSLHNNNGMYVHINVLIIQFSLLIMYKKIFLEM